MGTAKRARLVCPGDRAPEFTLPLLDGGEASLQQLLTRGPVLLAFFKISCPVCQFTMPYVERLFKAYGKQGVSVVGVSQDDASGTAQFAKEYGLSMPIVLEDISRYRVSNDYGLTNVPTLFYVDSAGEIEASSVGWSRADLEQISREMAAQSGATQVPLVHAGESVPDYKAG